MSSATDLLGALQIHVMRHMWALGTGTVHQVADLRNAELRHLGHPDLAYTTYLTVLRNLTHRGFLTQVKSAKKFHVFTPLVTKQDYRKRVVDVALQHFEGNAQALSDVVATIARKQT